MSFIYTGFGPIIEYQFRLSEGSNCVRLSQTWCWSDCRKKPIRSCTSAFTRRFATPFWMVLSRPIADCRRRGIWRGTRNVSQHNFNSLRTTRLRGTLCPVAAAALSWRKRCPICFFPPAAPTKAIPRRPPAGLFPVAANVCWGTSAPARVSGGVYPRRTGRQCISPPAVQ